MDQNELERRKRLTFEQAEGLVPLPSQFESGELTLSFRNKLWSTLWSLLSEHSEESQGSHYFGDPVGAMILREQFHRRHTPIDEIKTSFSWNGLQLVIDKYKEDVLAGESKLVLGLFQ